MVRGCLSIGVWGLGRAWGLGVRTRSGLHMPSHDRPGFRVSVVIQNFRVLYRWLHKGSVRGLGGIQCSVAILSQINPSQGRSSPAVVLVWLLQEPDPQHG